MAEYKATEPINVRARIWIEEWLAPKFCFSLHCGDEAQEQHFCFFESEVSSFPLRVNNLSLPRWPLTSSSDPSPAPLRTAPSLLLWGREYGSNAGSKSDKSWHFKDSHLTEEFIEILLPFHRLTCKPELSPLRGPSQKMDCPCFRCLDVLFRVYSNSKRVPSLGEGLPQNYREGNTFA